MEANISAHLIGIHQIKRKTQRDKLITVNRIANEIIKTLSENESVKTLMEKSEMPEDMKPFVRVEIAKQLKESKEIINALKSDDILLTNRALKAKWFFNGNNNSIKLYREQIWPFVSLKLRKKIIRCLANNITKAIFAEEFYKEVASLYGEDQAQPLLIVCSQDFIERCFDDNNFQLDGKRNMRFLFYKNPKIIINYLKRRSNDQINKSIVYKSLDLFNFLPRLIKKYDQDFVEIMELYDHYTCCAKLSKRRTKIFLNKCKDALIKNGELFLPILDLKSVSKLLTKEQFSTMLETLYPDDIERFQPYDSIKYLEFFEKEDKFRILLTSFEKFYEVNILNCSELINNYAFIEILPPEDRFKLARIQCEKITKDDVSKESYWISLLPLEESIPHLKARINSSTSSSDRCIYLAVLIDTCFFNYDKDALLEVLEYIWERHKDESPEDLVNIFFTERIDLKLNEPRINLLETLSQNHFDIIYKLIKMLHAKGLVDAADRIFKLMKWVYRFDIMNNIGNDKMNFIVDLFENEYYCYYLIYSDIEFEIRFLKELIKVLQSKNENNETYPTFNWIIYITCAVYGLNKHLAVAKKMSLKDFPWILNGAKKVLSINDDSYDERCLRGILRKKDKGLYDELILEMQASL
ncbi:uncharacterized protein LOC123266522 [Cotesia glomerata]|uniref:Uncharacterized protein n=1 Tax=Cotesia glomerata TaxID=32391 RepID=A0AAV7HWV1_COTGL|nr:uncharacterized protein LOC123266522 [Cotesia glomerata]XP_044586742.1 uncharacterized protein LOC123266522 [Cotesia glomerata]KAH0534499.1 hypothetical protein KQX54_004619 [Cotesia glomerata]